MKKLLLIILLIVGCDKSTSPSAVLCSDGYTEIQGTCYYQSDLDILQNFIDGNESLKGNVSLSEVTIGYTIWNDDMRLRALMLHKQNLTYIPSSIQNATDLETIYIYENQLAYIPSTMANMSLKILNLTDNKLTTLPENICNITEGQINTVFMVGGNCLSENYHYDCIGLWGDQDGCN